nr:MAG TPA: hypothetical protein [Caudoviricetes sp.]
MKEKKITLTFKILDRVDAYASTLSVYFFYWYNVFNV